MRRCVDIPDTSGQIDLFQKGQSGDKRSGFGIGSCPVSRTFTPRRGIVWRTGLSGLCTAVGIRIGSIGIGRVGELDDGVSWPRL